MTTGAEALYADLGHFGRKPIALAWYLVVFPALILNYLGQGALALRSNHARESILSHGTRVAALAFDCAGDRRGGDRLAGADFGSIFPDNAVGPNGLYALYQHPDYLARGALANLHPADQYSAGSRLHRARPHISQ